MARERKTRRQRNSERRRLRRQKHRACPTVKQEEKIEEETVTFVHAPEPPLVKTESLTEKLQELPNEFARAVVKRFAPEELPEEEEEEPAPKPEPAPEQEEQQEDEESSEEAKGAPSLELLSEAGRLLGEPLPASRTQLRKLRRERLPFLKCVAPRPDLVTLEDASAADPRLLLALKAAPFAVPIPAHWHRKRRYLQNKRGIDKVLYRLPEPIAATGIHRIRDALLEVDDEKSLKQVMRERRRPKAGALSMDYEKLRLAFQDFDDKGVLTRAGELYEEGKEREASRFHFRPGVLSKKLRDALGMQPGTPPPWLPPMQKLGPPPSYPFLRIPGVNAPLPKGCRYGKHQGGWGAPPVDEMGNPLFGDVFGKGAGAKGRSAVRFFTAPPRFFGEFVKPQ
eukprot:gnl/Chilomastix_cuspidata/3594.p1 GENE.gnl/Chilomastix_cuspidata/3594~~gnl/Chilomastix_cuspidata/3594.p1  ORF type:complete len:405 (+),score=183.95 gnl/Chilomastix_cuspidata/3594:28-1215(+)